MTGPKNRGGEEAPPTPRLTKKIVWRLPVVMAERGIYKRNKLQIMLKEIGIELSTVQVGRIFNEPPDAYKRQLLEGLMTVLDCSLSDLLHVVDVTPGEPEGGTKPFMETRSSKTPANVTKKPVEQVKGLPTAQAKETVPFDSNQAPGISKMIGPYDPKKGPKLGALPRPEPKAMPEE
jgi:DNA-binding Xre family transcriptional regulator